MESYFYRPGRAPRVACIGGGTGLSVMLRGLKYHTPHITAIVAGTDDGGGSGVLRDELGMLPPGDIRSCILALSNIEPTMQKLIDYRFTSGSLKGQSFGNLLLAAMNGISESFDQAVARMGEVLAITGRVLPVTNADVRLLAEFEDGGVVIGESKIAQAKKERGCRIRRIRLIPEPVTALPASVQAIQEADLILIGPGSLYTSLIPNLLVGGIAEAIERSRAKKIFVANIMTQPGETEGYTLSDHIRSLFAHAGTRLFDTCLVNNEPAPPEVLARYAQEGSYEVALDAERVRDQGVRVVPAFVAEYSKGLVRHHPDRLAEQIMRIYMEK